MKKKDEKDYKALLDYLIQLKSSSTTWTNRKEIAIWSVVVTYFALIAFVLRLIANNSICISIYINILTTVLVLVVFLFAILFVRMLSGSIQHEYAVSQAVNICVFKLIKEGEIPKGFVLKITEKYDTLPGSIRNIVDEQLCELRLFSFYKKLYLPFRVLKRRIINNKDKKWNKYNNHNISNFEINESIIYDLLILITIFYIMYAVILL